MTNSGILNPCRHQAVWAVSGLPPFTSANVPAPLRFNDILVKQTLSVDELNLRAILDFRLTSIVTLSASYRPICIGQPVPDILECRQLQNGLRIARCSWLPSYNCYKCHSCQTLSTASITFVIPWCVYWRPIHDRMATAPGWPPHRVFLRSAAYAKVSTVPLVGATS